MATHAHGPKNDPEAGHTDMVANGKKCFGCESDYGSYTLVDGDYIRVRPVQMHVTKTRKEGGTKEDVCMGCDVCNKIHGNGKGMPKAEFKEMIKKEFEQRGYRNIQAVIEVKKGLLQ